MSQIAKISVQKFDTKDEILYDFDKSSTLEDNIRKICKIVGLPVSKVYGLKYHETTRSMKNYYVSEDNYQEIEHNDCLKIVFSIGYITKRITDNIRKKNNLDLRKIAFDDILKLCTDPAFIQELARTDNHTNLIEVLLNDELSSEEQLGLLKTVLHLFMKEYIYTTTHNIPQKAINILKNSDTSDEELRFTLSLLHKILINPNQEFHQWKEKIFREVTIPEIVPYLFREKAPDLQYSALLLINTFIRLCKADDRTKLIKHMNSKKTRQTIYDSIIMSQNLDKNMEHELYVLQTYLLSLFSEALNSKLLIDENVFFKREEFELGQEDMKRITILMDFDDVNIQSQDCVSSENLAFNYRQSRISFASMRSEDSLRPISQRSSMRNFSESDDNTISHLTLEALRHYKSMHFKNFQQSQVEEHLYEPGIFVTSQRVVEMLARMLHVGKEIPDSRCKFYQPVIFYCSSKTPFFLELFSRTMWLLSRTRREMKVSTYADYEKVMFVLKRQVKEALNKRPKDFKSLTEELSNTSFKSVIDHMQRDKEKELENLIERHPCVQDLKSKLVQENEAKVRQNRMLVLMNGGSFPNVNEKKTNSIIFVQLNKTMTELLVYNLKNNEAILKDTISVSDITHVATGRNCEHFSPKDEPELIFSIIVNHAEIVKFVAKDVKMGCYWTDALLLLIKPDTTPDKLSKYFSQELNELVVMDIRLQLIEFQNVAIPRDPPPIPPLPSVLKPELPPKPNVKRKSRLIK